MGESGGARVVVCRVGGNRFALPVVAVREVVTSGIKARIPGAPAAVTGVVNLRGTLLTVISGAVLVGGAEPGLGGWLVVLAAFEGRVGIEVEEVEDIQIAEASEGVALLDVESLIRPLLAVGAAKG
ncbi:MAG: hypothetical protein HOP28_02575 [Gemmatimonadales bacterium]|nr:hypothetical protein [Gemmatimonadales bacterium]